MRDDWFHLGDKKVKLCKYVHNGIPCNSVMKITDYQHNFCQSCRKYLEGINRRKRYKKNVFSNTRFEHSSIYSGFDSLG